MPIDLVEFHSLAIGLRFRHGGCAYIKEAPEIAKVLRDVNGDVPRESRMIAFAKTDRVEPLSRRSDDDSEGFAP